MARYREGLSMDHIAERARTVLRIPADKPLVKVIVAEEALPQFKEVEEYRCPGCRLKVISDPCIVCTTQRIGKEKRTG